ncbi:hypothetical protein JOF53_002325 [Crossiella equi]|uniref:Uncharacterized protein n=1 Tax=Crossiella equi TaxID=130796 RepID=A0ABS5AA48_9PSEU|nr:hypothetical protein [Crossiella equi]MBP2473453.1 hypothetical protein [Crossiella equi]
MVISATRTGLVERDAYGGLSLWWSAEGDSRSRLTLPRRPDWPDGSWLRLAWDQDDWPRYRREHGRG